MKKYQIIYADPPWSYRSGKVQGAAQNHYQTMSDEQLYQLPVADLTAEDCALFLWCTFPKLPEAIKLISAWGFSFKTVAFVWVKQNKSGNGFWFYCGHRWKLHGTHQAVHSTDADADAIVTT